MDRLKKEIPEMERALDGLKHAGPQRESDKQQAEAALQAYLAEENTLRSLVEEAHGSMIDKAKRALESAAAQKENLGQKLCTARNELEKTFFLAFGKKAALRDQIASLERESARAEQEMKQCEKNLQSEEYARHSALAEIDDKIDSLRKAAQEAAGILDNLPLEIQEAEAALSAARTELNERANGTYCESDAKE